jgi:triosephosphate isomerase
MSSRNNRKIVIGNWKMNPETIEQAKTIVAKTKKAAAKLERTTVVVCPPFPFISLVAKKKEIKTGAQNVYFEDGGAFTGEVSAIILKNSGVSHVIIGHSERRNIMGESDDLIAKKAVAVARVGMTTVLCVGEKIRDEQGAYLDFLKNQIKNSLAGYPKKSLNNLIVAYEPIWAIGAKEAMTPSLVHEMTIFIKKVLSDMYGQEEVSAVAVLYGGSVNFRNAADIVKLGEVDGLLVGRESINMAGFPDLLKVVDSIK